MAITLSGDGIARANLAADVIDSTKLADDAVDSEHYVDASIDNAHLADDAVGVAELSATGTASSSTYLRGDNTWATISSFDPDAAVVFNESGADVDFRVEADDDTHALFIEGSNGNVGVGNTATQSEFSVTTGGATGGGQTMGIQVRQNGYSGYKSGMTAGDTSDTTYNCGFIGFLGGSHTGAGQRHIIFETRPGTTDAAPTERLRITDTGLGLSQFTAKGWCNVNLSGTQAIRDSHNVSSISDQGTGLCRVNWDVDLGNQHNYVPVAMAYRGAYCATYTLDHTSWDCDVRNDGGGMEDSSYMTVVAFSD
jgi:hypothetical protein